MKNDLADFRIIEPCPIEMMQFKNQENTICELLRQTYHMTEDDKIRINLRVAVTMAKKMGTKLSQYRKILKEVESGRETDKQAKETA